MAESQKQSETPTLLFPAAEEKIKNYPLYFWHVFGKLCSLLLFGVFTVIFSVILLPAGRLLFHKKNVFRYKMRYLVHLIFKLHTKFMSVFHVAKIKTNKPGKLESLRSAVIVSNHFAYLDPVILISHLKHATIIPKASLSKKSIMQLVINTLYMPNSVSYHEMIAQIKQDFADGNTIVVFPEGTRSSPYGQGVYKKGAARISLETGAPIIPIYIGGTGKKGLGKGDKILEYNHTKEIVFDLQIKDPIYPSEFKDFPYPIAVKKLTQKIHDVLSDEANKDYRY